MGAAQSVPVIGEIVTVVDAGVKTVAAGACAVLGKSEEADDLIKDAGQSLKHYADVNLITANVRMGIAAAAGDKETVEHLAKSQAEAWTDLAENTPVVGHAVGIVHYIEGDQEAGDRCMVGATRSAVLVGVTVATGGAGALACGAAAVASGLACDAVATGIKSATQQEYKPVGTIAGVTHAIETGSVRDWINAAEGPAADLAAGALHGGMKGVKPALPEPAGAAFELAERDVRAGSLVEEYRPFSEVRGGSPQVTLAEMRANPETAGMIKEFADPAEARSSFEPGQKYDFVRLTNGRVRIVNHADATRAVEILKSGKRVGHTSLIEPEGQVVAAGEVHMDANGAIVNINCQSGHFQVPLRIMSEQMGHDFPLSVLTNRSPTLVHVLMRGMSPTVKAIFVYSPIVLVFITDEDNMPSTPLLASTSAVAFHENDSVKILAFTSQEHAKRMYNEIPDNLAKVFMLRSTQQVLESGGDSQGVEKCKEYVRQINCELPKGPWKDSSSNIESWRDSTTGKLRLRCLCRRNNQGEVTNETEFQEGDSFENKDGQLVRV